MSRIACFWSLLLLFTSFCACKPEDASPVLAVTPEKNVLLTPDETFAFTANTAATWEVTGGSIDANGLYTAPSTAGVFEIKATESARPENVVVRKVVVTPHAALFKNLQQGGHVLYFRHTNATVGADDFTSTEPDWWKSCDSAKARQLSDAGRQEAKDIGTAFKNLELPFGTAIASEFCRCRQTAELMETGLTVSTSPAMTFTIYGEIDRYERTIALANAQPITDKLVLLASHSFPVMSAGPELQMGDMAVYKQAAGGVELAGVITLADLVALK